MIDDIFVPQEAEAIKKIHFAYHTTTDSLFRHLAQDRNYPCKFGYRFLRMETELDHRVYPYTHDTRLWKNIRALHSPNKVKNLIWRACRNSMPSKGNLVHRIVIDSPSCDQCNLVLEAPLRALWSYPMLDDVCNASISWDFCMSTSFSNFNELVSWIMQK